MRVPKRAQLLSKNRTQETPTEPTATQLSTQHSFTNMQALMSSRCTCEGYCSNYRIAVSHLVGLGHNSEREKR